MQLFSITAGHPDHGARPPSGGPSTRGGAIAALGALSELSSLAPGARRVDLEGRTLLPAFLDPHSHITALAATLSLCQLGAANSFEQIGLALRAFAEARRLPPDAWVMGFGYDHNVLAERVHPTRSGPGPLLSPCAGAHHPRLRTHGVANSKALP